jgi:hypothetical protein
LSHVPRSEIHPMGRVWLIQRNDLHQWASRITTLATCEPIKPAPPVTRMVSVTLNPLWPGMGVAQSFDSALRQAQAGPQDAVLNAEGDVGHQEAGCVDKNCDTAVNTVWMSETGSPINGDECTLP